MELFKVDLRGKSDDQLRGMECETINIIESVNFGVKGIGEMMQVVDSSNVSNDTMKNIGLALSAMGAVAGGAISVQNDIRCRLDSDLN